MFVSEAAGCCGVHIIRDFPEYIGTDANLKIYVDQLKQLVKQNENVVGVLQVNLIDTQKKYFDKTLLELGFSICASGVNSKTGETIYTYLRDRPTVKAKVSKLLGWEKK